MSELENLFPPFSAILLTKSYSYRLPIYKDDGSVWEFTASNSADGGSSSKTPPAGTPSQGDDMIGSSGSGDGERSKKSKKGKEREKGDKDETDEDNNKDPSNDPEGPPGDGDGDGIVHGPVEISISINSQIHLVKDKEHPGPGLLQTLIMHGSLTIEVFFTAL